MSFMTAAPEAIDAAAGALTGVGGSVVGTTAGVSPVITVVTPPSSADPTSLLMSSALSMHGGLADAALSAWLIEHGLYTATMGVSSASYAATEAANALTAL